MRDQELYPYREHDHDLGVLDHVHGACDGHCLRQPRREQKLRQLVLEVKALHR